MQHFIRLLTFTAAAAVVTTVLAADWITAPSTYTHDPQTGERVDQYTPIGPVYTYARQDFLRSGYRHTRSAIQVGGSMDNMHIVEEYGRPVRPYGEWQFPYRPHSVPYSMWGPPFAGLGYPYYPYPAPGPYDQGGRHPGIHPPDSGFPSPPAGGRTPPHPRRHRPPDWHRSGADRPPANPAENGY